MNRPGDQPLAFEGPWGGLNELISPKSVPVGEFVTAENAVNVAGRVGPRPGYTPLLFGSFAHLPLRFEPLTILGPVTAIAIKPDAGNPYASTVFWASPDTGEILSSLADGTGATAIRSGLTIHGLAYDAAGDRLYYDDGTTIERCDTVGGNIEVVVNTGITQVSAIAVTSTELLWVDSSLQTIKKVTHTGAVPQVGITIASGPPELVGIATDEANGHFFFTYLVSGTTYRLERRDIDGGFNSISIMNVGAKMWSLACDPTNNWLYIGWGTGVLGEGYISRITTTGTATEMAASYEVLLKSRIGAVDAIAPEPTAHWFYWAGSDLVSWQPMYRSYDDGNDCRIISSFTWDRKLAGLSESDWADDIVFLQILNTVAEEMRWAVWWPSRDDAYFLPVGHTLADEDRPRSLVLNDRDSPSEAGIDHLYQTKYGRGDFDFMGLGITSHVGGVIMCNGEGAHVLNYCLGDTIQELAIAVGETCTITFRGVTSGTIAESDTADDVRDTLQAMTPVFGRVGVEKGSETFTITLEGYLSCQSVELLTVNPIAGTPTISLVQAGGSNEGAMLYMLKAGLPIPVLDTFVPGSVGFGVLTGTFTYRLSWFSSRLGWESPASAISPEYVLNTQKIAVKWIRPSNLYFDTAAAGVPGGPLIDRLRIYRKRLDATSPSDDWYFLKEVQIDVTSSDLWTDGGVDYVLTSERAPKYGYPPDTAQFVKIHKELAFYMGLDPQEQRVWNSEPHNLVTLALGFVNVGEYSNAILSNTRASDHHATGLRSFRGMLVAFTNRDVFVISTDALGPDGGELVQQRVAGGAGAASQWCILETESMPEIGPRLLYPNDQGRFYEFTGAEATEITTKLNTTTLGLIKKTWAKTDWIEPGLDSWYYSSAVLDRENRRAIFSSFRDTGIAANPPVQLVLCIQSSAWFVWNIPSWLWFELTEWSGTTGLGRPIVIFGDGCGRLMKLQQGKGDNGEPFLMELLTGKLSLGQPGVMKLLHDIVFEFDIDGYGGATAPQVTLDWYPDGKTARSKGPVEIGSSEELFARLDARFKRIQFGLSSTIEDDHDQAQLISVSGGYSAVEGG